MSQLAFVTGATSGIGRATAEALAVKGYRLALAARNQEALETAAEELRMKYNAEVSVYVLDVRDRETIEKTAAACMARDGVPDVLVNDAGLARGLEPYGETLPEDIEQMIDTNIKGLFHVTRAFLPAMLKRNKGHIINLGSTAGLYAYAGAAVYCATKAAVKTFSDGIRIDVIDSDIKVTTIQPGIVKTAFSEVRFHGDKKKSRCRLRRRRRAPSGRHRRSHFLRALSAEARTDQRRRHHGQSAGDGLHGEQEKILIPS